MDEFTNLHLHTLYSLQDSVIKIEDLVNKLVEYGQTACAVTDHSSTAAYYEFKEACLSKNIKPIFGNEFYLLKDYETKSRNRDHLVCLAMNNEGILNINWLQNEAVNHFYYKPILSYESLRDHTDGLIGTSACSLGIIPKMILEDNLDKAWDYMDFFMEIFNCRFALELQFHPEYKDQYKVNEGLLRLHELSGVPLTVSTDAHLIDDSYLTVRKAVKAISYKTSYEDALDSLYSNCVGSTDLVLKFAEETEFDLSVARKAIKMTKKLADMCDADLCNTDRKVPVFEDHDELIKLMDEVL